MLPVIDAGLLFPIIPTFFLKWIRKRYAGTRAPAIAHQSDKVR